MLVATFFKGFYYQNHSNQTLLMFLFLKIFNNCPHIIIFKRRKNVKTSFQKLSAYYISRRILNNKQANTNDKTMPAAASYTCTLNVNIITISTCTSAPFSPAISHCSYKSNSAWYIQCKSLYQHNSSSK